MLNCSVYSSPAGHWTSGVGQRDDPTGPLLAPSDPAKRYDDVDLDARQMEDFPVMIHSYDGIHGYICHEKCWNLLREALKPNEIPLDRFIDICESSPFTYGALDWGHDYGGIYDIDFEVFQNTAYPWKSRLIDMQEPTSSNALRYALEDPYNVPGIARILLKTAHESSTNISNYSLPVKPPDCFGIFPWEIREAIANALSTRDALSLRQASRSFYSMVGSPAFWASRFRYGADRGFLFEKSNAAESRDWLSLYRMTSYRQCPPGLKNRRRIWGLVEYIVQLINLRSKPQDGDIDTSNMLEKDESKFIIASANTIHSSPQNTRAFYATFRNDCRVFRKQYASLEPDVTTVSFSFVGFGERGYLSGLSFGSRSGQNIRVGYFSEKGPAIYNVKNLKGFVLAVDSQGIRALQVVGDGGEKSQWFGNPANTPITERLAFFSGIKDIRVEIDVSHGNNPR
ncbi:hypothetical protein N7456_007596 [Penicillium angulare]|uniref:DUF7600 domain-containing protein n=1 Tax=Penicillium angulare TaxID=116970 RepID=A0A9W9FAZ3_9EURO|nr:hypothetical protein N7456_007596 [Penicillium angulare]